MVMAQESDGTLVCAMRAFSREGHVKMTLERLRTVGVRPVVPYLAAFRRDSTHVDTDRTSTPKIGRLQSRTNAMSNQVPGRRASELDCIPLQYQLNWRLLVASIACVAIFVPSLYFWHRTHLRHVRRRDAAVRL